MASVATTRLANRGLVLLLGAAVFLNYVDRGAIAVAAWWLVVWLGLRRKTLFAGFSFLCAACAVASLVGQVVWEPPAGAVPARFAYVLWGPWGLWLAAASRKA